MTAIHKFTPPSVLFCWHIEVFSSSRHYWFVNDTGSPASSPQLLANLNASLHLLGLGRVCTVTKCCCCDYLVERPWLQTALHSGKSCLQTWKHQLYLLQLSLDSLLSCFTVEWNERWLLQAELSPFFHIHHMWLTHVPTVTYVYKSEEWTANNSSMCSYFRFQCLASSTGSKTFKLQIVSLRTRRCVDHLSSCNGGNNYINCVYEFIQICGKFWRERPHNLTVTPP